MMGETESIEPCFSFKKMFSFNDFLFMMLSFATSVSPNSLFPFRDWVGFMDISVFCLLYLLYHTFLYLREYAHTISFLFKPAVFVYQHITLP